MRLECRIEAQMGLKKGRPMGQPAMAVGAWPRGRPCRTLPPSPRPAPLPLPSCAAALYPCLAASCPTDCSDAHFVRDLSAHRVTACAALSPSSPALTRAAFYPLGTNAVAGQAPHGTHPGGRAVRLLRSMIREQCARPAYGGRSATL